MAEDLFEVHPSKGGQEGEGTDVVLRLSVQPGAGRAAVVGRHGDALRIRVAPPPADGRANEAVVRLVAELLGVPERDVELVSGQRSRQKRIRVEGADPAEVSRRLDEAIAQAKTRPGGGRPSRVGG